MTRQAFIVYSNTNSAMEAVGRAKVRTHIVEHIVTATKRDEPSEIGMTIC